MERALETVETITLSNFSAPNAADKAGHSAMDSFELDEQLVSPYRPRTVSMHRNTNRRMSRGAGANSQDWLHAASTLGRVPVDEHVNHIVDKIEEEECLLGEDRRQGEGFRQDALRNMPQSLAMKRMVKEKLNMRSKRGKKISVWKQMKFSWSMSMKKCNSRLHDFLYAFELWYSTMKTIEGEFGSATAIYFRFFRLLFLLNLFAFCLCFCFIALPQILQVLYSDNELQSTVFSTKDIFTGEGYFKDTTLFYGSYTNESITIAKNVSYSMPRGYFYTMISVYVIMLLILALSMAKSYRVNFIETKGGLKNVFAHKVFCNWDYGIATEDAAKLKSSAIYHEFKELLDDELRPAKRSTYKERFLTFMLRLAANLLILAVVGAIGYAMWKLLETHRKNKTDETTGIITALVINAVIYIVPVFLSLISRHEDYRNPRKAFNVTLLRSFLLQAVVIGVLAAFWLSQAHKITCWETVLGQEVYRLLIFDFLFAMLFFVLEKIGLILMSQFKRTEVDRPEFEIANHTLQLIYNQTLFWLGLMFAPLLTALIVIKYLVMWYFVTNVVIKFCKPSSKFWRATHTQTWFLVMAFVALILVMGVLGSLIAIVQTSTCGPFRDYDFAYSFLKDEILNFEKGFLVWKVLVYFLKPGVVFLIIISMVGFIYYLRAKAIAQEKMVGVLRDMIVVESKDKEYLLNRIHMLSKEWKFTSSALDPTKTPSGKYHIPEESQTEFQRNESTNVPHRNDEATSITSTMTQKGSRKMKNH